MYACVWKNCTVLFFLTSVVRTDSFEGEVVDPETMEDPVKREKFDIGAFVGRHSKEIRYPAIKAAAESLKKEYPKVVRICLLLFLSFYTHALSLLSTFPRFEIYPPLKTYLTGSTF